MSVLASQITGHSAICLTYCSGQHKGNLKEPHNCPLARGIQTANALHKEQVSNAVFRCDDVTIKHPITSPSAAYMRQWSGSALLQVKAWRLTGAKPLFEPMLEYCWVVPWQQTSVRPKSRFIYFHWRKCIGNCRQEIVGYFVTSSMC